MFHQFDLYTDIDNLVNLHAATEDGEEEEDVLAADEAPAQDAVINPPAQAPVGPAASGGTGSEDGSAAPAAEPGPPTPALLHKMEMALRGLENQRGHNHPSVRPPLAPLYTSRRSAGVVQGVSMIVTSS